MMTVLTLSKETRNKIRWDAVVDDAQFELYIPKWRVPDPLPVRIFVEVSHAESANEWKRYDPLTPPSKEEDRNRPILALVERVCKQTKTVRFKPRGDPNNCEIGEPYIPFTLLPDPLADRVLIKVEWDLSGKGVS